MTLRESRELVAEIRKTHPQFLAKVCGTKEKAWILLKRKREERPGFSYQGYLEKVLIGDEDEWERLKEKQTTRV